jgi:molybdopterin converting factor small subunit
VQASVRPRYCGELRYLCEGDEAVKEVSQGEIANGLLGELLKVFNNYEGTLFVPTALGVLELIKIQLILEHMQKQKDGT